MKKAINYIWDNILFLSTLFLLIFIPLYPKLPLIDIRNTWVYIRAEDFILFFVFIIWIILLIKEKITFKTPLTIPILIFWAVGAVATLHGVLIVFPELTNAFPNVAFLSLVRQIEYLGVFFIAFAGIKNKNQIKFIIGALVVTLLGVVFYGFGQRYLGFPAYLTMNEEFAKGVGIQLSALSRVPSTFAGHYDLAAYLVLVIPIFASLFFGFKNWFIRIGLAISSLLGLILLFMTVSRVSFFVLFIALFIVVFFQKRKLLLLAVPLGIIMLGFLLTTQSSLFDRFKNTVSETDVLVDAKTGESLGHVNFVEREYFQDKLVLQRRVGSIIDLNSALSELERGSEYYSSPSAVLSYELIPLKVPLVKAINLSTGEELIQGTGYVNLYLSPVTQKLGSFYYELPPEFEATPSADVLVIGGDYIVKRARAYDLSFTTRFQGEWPNAVEAFKNNLLVGSGYGSVSLAVDNNYLRILGETGILGFLSFFMLFLILGIYIKKIFPDIDSDVTRSFIIGFGAGLIGLSLNAILIDVFAASKIAYLMWLLFGVTFGILILYQKTKFSIWNELIKVATSSYAVILYLFLAVILLYLPALNNYFVADDFTWLRWAADCGGCNLNTIINYFTVSDGFFYRPGTKIMFYLLYHTFWLNQVIYHLLSLMFHFAAAALVYLIALRIFKNNMLSGLTAIIFIVLAGISESVFWISALGHMTAAVLGLIGLYSFILYEEKKKLYLYLITFISFALSLLFHEYAVVFPLLLLTYQLTKPSALKLIKNTVKSKEFIVLLIPIAIYLIMRFISGSHWSGGDYNYNLILLPFNFLGNLIGYTLLTFIGPMSLPIYSSLRNIMKENVLVAAVMLPFILAFAYLVFRFIKNTFSTKEKRILNFGVAFFVVSLLPFLGLGNISIRYDHFASIGLVFVFVVIIKKLYDYLLKSGKEIALGAMTVLVLVFVMLQVIQVQQSYSEWSEAGNKVRNFFISIDGAYEDFWSNPNIELHIVDIPIRIGNAWIFPVGLEDAIWFAFKNDEVKIFKYTNLQEALDVAGLYRSKVVLEFNDDGSVTKIDRFKNIPLNLIMP
jgi:hypothetical protein